MGAESKFYAGPKYCSHDDGVTFHREHWTCWLRLAIMQGHDHPRSVVTEVDYQNGRITVGMAK